jgi:hypothetical protein
MIPQHQEQNHQATANSPTVYGVLGFLMSPIGTSLTTVWAGNCNQCQNWIRTSCDIFTRIPFLLWLLFSDDVTGFRCAWRSRVWYSDGNAWSWGIGFCWEEFDACYLNQRWGSSTVFGTPDDTVCIALDNQQVVRIEITQWKSTHLNTEVKGAPHPFRVDWGWTCTIEDSCGEIHLTGCLRSAEGSQMVANRFLSSVGSHQGLRWCF